MAWANTGVNTAASNSTTIPAGSAAGELAVCFMYTANPSMITVPTGFTQIFQNQNGSSSDYFAVAYKYLESGDPGASISATMGSSNMIACATFSGVSDGTQLDVSANGVDTSANTGVSFGSITPTGDGHLVVWGFGASNDFTSTMSAPSGITDFAELFDFNATGADRMLAGYWGVQTTAGSVSGSATKSGSTFDNFGNAAFFPTTKFIKSIAGVAKANIKSFAGVSLD